MLNSVLFAHITDLFVESYGYSSDGYFILDMI